MDEAIQRCALLADSVVVRVARCMRGAVALVGGFRDGFIDDLVKVVRIDDFHVRHPGGLVGDNPDGGGVFNPDALAQRVISLHFRRKFSLRVDGKWKSDAVLLGEFVGERAQFLLGLDTSLVGKDGIAKIVA